MQGQGELHHDKTGFKIFVIVIPKEGLADTSPAKPSFGMTPTMNVCEEVEFYSRCHTKRKLTVIGLAGEVKPSFDMTMIKILIPF